MRSRHARLTSQVGKSKKKVRWEEKNCPGGTDPYIIRTSLGLLIEFPTQKLQDSKMLTCLYNIKNCHALRGNQKSEVLETQQH